MKILPLLAAGVYLLLTISALKIEPLNVAQFLLWVVLLVYPMGRICLIPLGRHGAESDSSENTVLSLGVGIIALSFLTVIFSLMFRNAALLRAALFSIAPLAWMIVARTRALSRECRFDPIQPALVFILAAVHLLLLPNYFSGLDPSGSLVINGMGEDSWYFTFTQQIASHGGLIENPFYAGFPYVKHHFFSEFLVGSYSVLLGPNADFFQIRLLFHFVLGLPLLIALIYSLLKKLNVSTMVTGGLLLALILPATYYPQRAGWSGLIGSSAFWLGGVHGDMGYLTGLIMFIMLPLLLMNFTSAKQFNLGALICLQAILALSTQFKANFSLACYPAVQLILIYHYVLNRKYKLAMAAPAIALAFLGLINFGILDAICSVGLGRGIGLEYGTVVLNTFLPILAGNSDLLFSTVNHLYRTAWMLQPFMVVLAYSTAYAPLFPFVCLYFIFARTQREVFDLYLIAACVSALAVILFVVEKSGTKWNVSGHLHYLIPVFAIFAVARLSCHPLRHARFLARAGLAVAITVSMWRIASGVNRFKCFGEGFAYEKDFITLCHRIKNETSADSILIVNGKNLEFSERYIALLTNRSLFSGYEFILFFPTLYENTLDRKKTIELALGKWPRIADDGIAAGDASVSGRKFILIGKLDKQFEPLRTALSLSCEGPYCFREVPGRM